jgi:hypothetical protein
VKTCDLLLDEHEEGRICDDVGHRKAIAARADCGEPWIAILRGEDGGGPRDFLDAQPIHCGSGLELQAIEYRDDDYGSYTVRLPIGARVRYEMAWGRDGQRRVVLYGDIAGHTFTTPLEPWMRFRWPPEKKRW